VKHGKVYVAGSSVFATAGQCTPTTTITALWLRLGDHLSRVVAT
jgi:choline dehydrogenase-like flavoprotein